MSYRKQRIEYNRLGEFLIEQKAINQRQLDRVLEMQKRNHSGKRNLIGELLIEEGFIKEEKVLEALVFQYRFPYIMLSRYNIDPELAKIVPEHMARELNLIPVEKIKNSLSIAMSNPLDNAAISLIESVSNCSVQIFISTKKEINVAINKYYNDIPANIPIC